ncbi:hypothetical protein OnM2_013038 [Erysiphe neolycopersici]|uniref:Uncharacterized protein n=1 Tax=Erysiphe neolycopersici TaxID=212602 RepID=A0A420I5N2_9PEZI|nr:hypothetical protein OnM2_013038 [Erysiphe neolycopersici]
MLIDVLLAGLQQAKWNSKAKKDNDKKLTPLFYASQQSLELLKKC